jgi:hypothetical protein
VGSEYTGMPQREQEPGTSIFKGCEWLFGEKRVPDGFSRSKCIFATVLLNVKAPVYEIYSALVEYRRPSFSTAIDDPIP